MTRDPCSSLTSALAFAGAAALAVALTGSFRAAAQGWNTEVTATVNPPTPQRKLSRAAAARAAAREQTEIKMRKKDIARMPREEVAPEPVQASTAATQAPAPSPAAAAPPPAAEADAMPSLAPSIVTADSEPEPDDPFVDLRVLQRAPNGEEMTTQVVPAKPGPSLGAAPAETSAAGQYCNNIADAAIDARIAWQRQNLAEAEKEVQKRTVELVARTAEFQRWLQRRDDFAEKAKKTVVDIYTKMKPDAAALQLQVLDEETAAAVIIKLDPRTASAVMNEMEPVQAARLTAIISGAAKLPGKPRPPAPQGNPS
jgi:flagellar motility protein MotE (MotC chaperone)